MCDILSEVIKKDGQLLLTAKAYSNRCILEWLHDAVTRACGTSQDPRTPLVKRRIPELHLSNCAWNWYQFKSCFCICVHVLYDVAIYQRHSTQSVWYANAIRHGILARQIQTTKKAGDYQGMLWRVSLDWWNATLGFCFFGRSWDISCVQSSLTLHYSWTLLIPLSNRIQNHYAYYIIYYI